MLAWQIALIGFSSLYTCNTLLLSSKASYHINESTLNLIGVCLIGSMCLIILVYVILMSCYFFNAMCHVVAGWIFLVVLTFSYWQHQDRQFKLFTYISNILFINSIVIIYCLSAFSFSFFSLFRYNMENTDKFKSK